MRGLISKLVFCLSVAFVGGSTNSTHAGDAIWKPPPPTAPSVETLPYDRSGVYLGGHFGYGTGRSDWAATQAGSSATSLGGSLDFFNSFDAFKGTGSYCIGLQAGYSHMTPSRLVLGVEADFTAPNTIGGQQTISSSLIGKASYGETVLLSGTARGRLGYAFDQGLVYVIAGFAWTHDQLMRTQVAGVPVGGSAVPGATETQPMSRLGVAAGAGLEVPLTGNWAARFEYLFTEFGSRGVTFPLGAQRFDSDLVVQSLRVGLNYRIGEDAARQGNFAPTALEVDSFNFHGQTTFVEQYAFPFRSPYRGPHSLDPNAGRETWDVTFYAGFRLWRGAELWINPEIDQGFGLSDTLGVAGFTSGEAYKVGAVYPYARLPRAFIRQTIDLGGESEKVESGANQFAGSQTKDRLVVTLGKFAVTDVFDTNKYAHDPRSDFLNWAIIDTGTFDYAADAWGYTYGAAAEWYRGPWTLRAGIFDMSIVPNSSELDPTFRQFQWIGEVEHRHELWGQPGKIAITGFLTRGRMGRFQDAIEQAAMTGGSADIAAVRHYTSRTGISVNLEQQLSSELGVFARAGIADGTVEPYEFSDIDRTMAAGLSLSGKKWGRPDDTLGFAAVVNDISGIHQAFLNAGGLGILVGDGKLPHPGPEQIIEVYYKLPISTWQATLDYQFIANPAHNRDRGPVSVIAARLHAQF